MIKFCPLCEKEVEVTEVLIRNVPHFLCENMHKFLKPAPVLKKILQEEQSSDT